jgi:metal-sulfur cluster biosynthetic enzyme
MEDEVQDAQMYDNPAPIVYERAPGADEDDDDGDDDDAAADQAGGKNNNLLGGCGFPTSSAAALAALARLGGGGGGRSSGRATTTLVGPWEAAFDPRAAGLAAEGGEEAAGSEAAAEAAGPPPPAAPPPRQRQREPIDAREVFSLVRDIRDPEHPYSLEQLGVVSRSAVRVDDARGTARVDLTPTVDHCSMATLIGLCVKARLDEGLPPRFKVRVRLAKGSHATEQAVNRQLADKERVAAAMENARLRAEVDRCLAPG